MAFLTKRITVAAMALVLASAMTAGAAPQRGGGGGHGFGGGGHGFGGGPARGRGPGIAHGQAFGGPQRFEYGRFHSRFYGGFYPYDPFYGYGLFPFSVNPYGAYAYGLALDSDIRVKVAPKDAQVFVDSYYAGEVDNFDGVFQRLHVTPGGHVITIYLDGYRTVSRSVYAPPYGSVTFSDRMAPLSPGEVSAPPAAPVKVTPPPTDSGQ